MSDSVRESSRYFDKQPHERQSSFEKFCAYRSMPPGSRSLRKLAQELGVSSTSLGQLSVKYDWQARVQAWDDEREAISREALEEHEREAAREIAQARKRIQMRLVEAEDKFSKKILTMADSPLYAEQTVIEEYEDGRPKTLVTYFPADWNFGTVVKALAVMSESGATQDVDPKIEAEQWGQSQEELIDMTDMWLEQRCEEMLEERTRQRYEEGIREGERRERERLGVNDRAPA